MKNNINLFLLVFCIIGSFQASAVDTGVKGLSLNGRVTQGYTIMYDLDGQGKEEGPQRYVGELNLSYTPSRKFTFTGNFWIRGMWNNPDWIETEGGLKNLSSGPPFPSGSFQHGTNNCNLAAYEFCQENNSVDIYDDFNKEVIRELAVKYRDPKRRFTAKIGKFQRGWGQSDGLRLLDIINPLDLRDRFAFNDSEDLRIPLWMASFDFNLDRLGFGKTLKSLGMKRTVLEVNITPEIRHSAIVVNNPTPGIGSDGGQFGLPWPNLVDVGLPHQSGLGAVGLGARLIDVEKDEFEFSDPEVSMRLKFEALGGVATLNAFYGYQDLPLVTMKGATLHIGSGVNDAENSLANVPVDHQALLGAIWAPNLAVPGQPSEYGVPSGYLPFLRGAAGKGPLTISPLYALTAGSGSECIDPINSLGSVPCSITVDLALDYTFRQKVIGGSFSRDLSDKVSFGPKGTAPTVRLELSHEFDKPFNKSVVENPFVFGQSEQGAVANLVSESSAIVERDVTQIMIGFDYPLWIPGWESQSKSIFTSVQFFNFYTEDADNLMSQAPYGYSEVESNQKYLTFLWDMKLDNEKIILEGLFIRNISGNGTAYRQRIDFNYFGKNIRPRVEIQSFSGQAETAPIGFFDEKDFIEFSLTYQF
jgi:hypothetical protein